MRLPLMSAAAMTMIPALLLPLTSPSPSTAAEPAPIIGTYECQGTEPDGTPYRGVVQIMGNAAGLYEIVWTFSSGQQYAGFGVLNGDVLAVSYFTNRPGVAAYKVEMTDNGPRLLGQWTVAGAGEVFAETLTQLTKEVTRLPAPAPRRAPIPSHLRPA